VGYWTVDIFSGRAGPVPKWTFCLLKRKNRTSSPASCALRQQQPAACVACMKRQTILFSDRDYGHCPIGTIYTFYSIFRAIICRLPVKIEKFSNSTVEMKCEMEQKIGWCLLSERRLLQKLITHKPAGVNRQFNIILLNIYMNNIFDFEEDTNFEVNF
jgi:hypothetical protein